MNPFEFIRGFLRTNKQTLIVIAIPSGLLLLCYLLFLTHIEQYEIGIARNPLTGNLVLQQSGLHLSAPWVRVARIDTRPQRVCVASSTRAINCKLVQFNPNEYRAFVQTEGFRYYWWSNRISFNFGYDDEYRGMRDILRGYAYSIEPYPFIRILEDKFR